jgi:mono/diheme cytochrome c family protein
MRMPVRQFFSFVGAVTFLSVVSVTWIGSVFGADMAKAKKIYVDKCLKCHGDTGKGDGPKADTLETKAADYTNKKEMAKFTDADLIRITKDGKKPMPGYATKLTDQEIADVIAYVRIFAKP